ncbi:MAG: serine/threonine-protein kinase [Coleofasciculaceae cyanobacterium]
MNTEENQSLIGKYLNGRYQITQFLSAGSFSQTYIAIDTWQRENPQCLVKHLKAVGVHPKQWEFGRNRFSNEVETLKKLRHHDQIPQLIDFLEDNQGFYLLQELIVGQPLSAELPISRYSSKRWSEVQCVELLQQVFGILEFVHRQGIIHGDIKPSHLIRRASDGRLFLIDFGAAHQMDSGLLSEKVCPELPYPTPLAIRPLGYKPIEQRSGYPHPNSDIYALGMIAIQALTGIQPADLPINAATNEVDWRQQVWTSESMTCLLNYLVRYNCQERCQYATDALEVLDMLAITNKERGVRTEELFNRVISYCPPASAKSIPSRQINSSNIERCDCPRPESNDLGGHNQALSRWSKLMLLTAGTGVGMATLNGVAISLGLYSLMHAAPAANEGLDFLAKARQQYEAGNFERAIALAESIPTESSVYQQSVTAQQKWRQEWDTAQVQFERVEQAFHQKQWRDLLEQARQLPNQAFWQRKISPFVLVAANELEKESQTLLQQAYEKAARRDFRGAIALIEQIPPETTTGTRIQPKLAEYSRKREIKAEYLLQQAYEQAANRNFAEALEFLSQISSETSTYEKAQIKMVEYSHKQHYQEEVDRQVKLARAVAEPKEQLSKPFNTDSFVNTNSELNAGSYWQEVIPIR